MDTPAPSLWNFAAVSAVSFTPSIQLPAMSPSTGRPWAWRNLALKNAAAFLAMSTLVPSGKSFRAQ
jgi:hypothetical protein